MFIGHFALGFAAANKSAGIKLGTAFIAVQFLDLLWPFLVLSGIEVVQVDPGNTALTPLNFIYYPYSHSLFAALFWSVITAGVIYLFKQNKKGAIIFGMLVFSHWILDWITHRADLPISPWSEIKTGLGLWNSITASIITEVILFTAGVYIYMKNTRSDNRKGSILFWSFVIFLLATYAANLLGPPPPDGKAVAMAALSMWLLVAWGYWIDRNRTPVPYS